MISQLDHMVMEGGKGDGMYKAGFPQSFFLQCWIVLHGIWQTLVLESESEKSTLTAVYKNLDWIHIFEIFWFENLWKKIRRQILVMLKSMFEMNNSNPRLFRAGNNWQPCAHYQDKFRDILMCQCEQHMALKELGTVFVSTVTRLMELLLEYREGPDNVVVVVYQKP